MIGEAEYLRSALNYLQAFSEPSGLKCNLDKTKVIPIGDFYMSDKICHESELECESDFTLL